MASSAIVTSLLMATGNDWRLLADASKRWDVSDGKFRSDYRSVLILVDNLAAAVIPIGTDVVAEVGLAGGGLDRQRGTTETVMGTTHATS
jgi:hypothetical protein